MRFFVTLSLVLLAACGGGSSEPVGSTDLKAADATFCTTAACASSPCTVGCTYAPLAGSCPTSAPSQVRGSVFTSCANRCGLRTMPDGTSFDSGAVCWKLDEQAAGCTYLQPGCHEYDAACYPIEFTAPQGGAVICNPVDNCVDGATPPVEDASVSCVDMTVPMDFAVVD